MNEEGRELVLKVKLFKDEKQMNLDLLQPEELQENSISTDQNWQSYMMKLSSILSENNLNPEFRNMAASKLRNALTAKDGGLLQMKYDHRWLSFNKTIRQYIKDNILKSLGNDTTNPSPAALCVVSIAAAEFPNGQWPDLINNLIKNIVDGNTSETVKEASFQTISYLCQELGPDGRNILQSNSQAILKAILLGMKDANSKIVVAAVNSLENAADLFDASFEVISERNMLMQIIYDTADINEVNVQAAVMQCLKSVMSHHFQHLDDCIDPIFFEIALECLRSDYEILRFKAIDFFKEVCYVEDELRQKASKTGRSFYGNRFYTVKALSYLVPAFMELLTKFMTDKNSNQKETETWDKYLGFLKELIVCCGHSNVDHCIMNFIRDNIISNDWRNRKAALAAFNTIMTDNKENFEPLVPPLIQIMVEDENVEVRAAAALAVSEMCTNILQKDKYQEVIIPALLHALKDEINVATVVCNAISYLAHAGKWNQPKYFVTVVHLLLEIITRPEADNRLKWEATYALHFIVGRNETKSYYAAHKTAIKIINIIEKFCTPVKCDEHLTILNITLETFLKKLPVKIANQISDMVMNSLIEFIKVKMNVLLEINLLPLMATLIKNSGSDFNIYLDEFKLYLMAVLNRSKQPNLDGIRLIRDLSQIAGDGLAPYCDEIIPLLLSNLLENDTNLAIKKEILIAITFVVLAVGENFEEYVEITISALTNLQNRIDTIHITNLNLHKIAEMHKYILKPYRAITHTFKGDKKKIFDILNKLEPYLIRIIEIITKIMQIQNQQLDVFMSMCMEEVYDLCCIIDSKMLTLIETESINLLVVLGSQSASNDNRSLAALINKKIDHLKNNQINNTRQRAGSNTKRIKNLFHRGLNYFLILCRCVNLFPKRFSK